MKLNVLLCRAVATMLALAFAALGHAQEYPTRSVKIIVPYVPGGQADSGVRAVAFALTKQLGQSFVVENLAGSSGIVAMQVAMRAPADGYTLVYSDSGQYAINPALYGSKLPYDTLRDFTPIGLIADGGGLFLVVHASLPANNLQELVALVKAKPDFYTYASSGIGTGHHLTMEDFKARLGLKILHIPYKGTGQSVPALIAGQVSMGIAGLVSVAGFVKEGRLKLLGVNTAKSVVFAPNVPPMGDVAGADFDHGGGLGLLAPAGTPRAIIDKLSVAITKALTMPDTVTRFAAIGIAPAANSSPERLAETIREGKLKYAHIVKNAGISLD